MFSWKKFNENSEILLDTPEEKENYIKSNIKAIKYSLSGKDGFKLEVPFSSNFSLGVSFRLNDNGTANLKYFSVVFSGYNNNKKLMNILDSNNIVYTIGNSIGIAGVCIYHFTGSENNATISLNVVQEIYDAVISAKKAEDNNFGEYMKAKGGSNSGIGNMD